jgi:hypothetical protein
MTIRTSVSLARTGRMLSEDLLATERAVSSTTAVGISTDITIGVSDIVLVLLVEGVVCHSVEALSPEHQALF